MNTEFWQQCWQDNRIHFHRSKVNPRLVAHIDALPIKATHNSARILVPLCGKSVDMIWLAEQGYDVVGIELATLAVEQFFAELKIAPTLTQYGKLSHYHAQYGTQNIDIWQGDIFDITASDVGRVDAIYDRAALVALPDEGKPSLRQRYTEQLISISNKAPQLLLTFDFDQQQCPAPPFAIKPQQLATYYEQAYNITLLEKRASNKVIKEGVFGYYMVWLLAAKQ